MLAKIEDYGVENYAVVVEAFRRKLADIVSGDDFLDQMKRFIPGDVQERTLNQPGFIDYLIDANTGLLQKAVQITNSPDGSRDFMM